MASDILSYNLVQGRIMRGYRGIPIKGYRGLRPPSGDLIYYSDLSVLKPWICMFRRLAPSYGTVPYFKKYPKLSVRP